MPTTAPGQEMISELNGIKSMINAMRIDIADAKRTSATALNETRTNTQRINTVDTKATNAESEAKRVNQKVGEVDKKVDRVDGKADSANRRAGNAEVEARTAKGEAGTANSKADNNSRRIENVDRKASKADRDAAAAFGEAKSASGKADNSLKESMLTRGVANNAATEAKSANKLANTVKKSVDVLETGLDKLSGFIRRVEGLALDASIKALKAIGVADDAIARTLKLSGQVISITSKVLGIIDTIGNMLTLIFALRALGGRIDAVERIVQGVDSAVSNILGRWIPEVRGIAKAARGTAENAYVAAVNASSSSAMATAKSNDAINKAEQAQLTANLARQEAKQANGNAIRAAENALTAYIGARTALSLYQSLRNRPGVPGRDGRPGRDGLPGRQGERGLRGERGLPGVQGRQGDRGWQGIPGNPGIQGLRGYPGIAGTPGRDGRDGLPGMPGKDGRPGINGINGKDGRDVNPADVAAINAQLAALRQQQAANQAETRGLLANLKFSVFNSISNLADLALLKTINEKLGSQIAGGISGKLMRVGSWLMLDRLLNIMTFAATVHNAVQLSNNIAVTLSAAIDNVVKIFGISDSDGNDFELSDFVGNSISNFIKSIVGEENFTSLNTAWLKANRIYQASSNVLNNLMNVNAVVTNALEIIGGYTGKIGNALRIWGVVGEKAYSWMNPQPSFDNKWVTKLQQLQENANTIQMVSQIPVDVTTSITEFNNSTTEMIKAIKQDPNTKDGVDPGEAAKVKEERESAKIASYVPAFDISDLFDADD